MSRKTRKIMWSAPIAAVFAVVGALALFVALAPTGTQAHDVELPGAVSDLKATPDGTTAVDLEWKAPTTGGTPTGYRIDVSSNGQTWTSLMADTGSTATTYRDDMVSGVLGSDRFYRVFAMNEGGTGPVSQTAGPANVPDAGAPGNVTGITAMAMGRKAITLTWSEPSNTGGTDAITKYLIAGATGVTAAAAETALARLTVTALPATNDDDPAGDIVLLATPDANTSYTLEGLSAGQTWFFRVFAYNGERVSAGTAETRSATTDSLGKIGPATGLRAIAEPIAASVNLYWYWPADDGGRNITHWEIERKQTALATGQTAATNADVGLNTWGPALASGTALASGNVTASDAVASLDFTDTTVQAGGKYQYRVTARTGDDAADPVFEGTTSSASNTVTVNAVVADCDTITAVDTSLTGQALADDQRRFDDQTDRCALEDAKATNDNVEADRDGKGNVEVTVTRENPRKATSFRIDVSPDGNKWRSVSNYVGNLGNDDEFVYEYLDETTGGDLYYRVFAYVGSTQLLPANPAPEQAGIKKVTAPGKVENLKATAVSQTQIDVTWSAPIQDGDAAVDMYCVQIWTDATGDGFDALAADTEHSNDAGTLTDTSDTAMSLCAGGTAVGATDTFILTDQMSYSHKKLMADQTRFYKVYAINNPVVGGDGRSVSSDTVSETTMKQDKPMMPTGLTAETAKDSNYGGSANAGTYLLWNKPPNPTGGSVDSYVVQKKVDDGDWANLESDTGNPWTIYHDMSEPAEGEMMRAYRVAAMNSSGTGAWSEAAYYPADTTHTHTPAQLGPPANVEATADGNTVTITWGAAVDADRYIAVLLDSNFEIAPEHIATHQTDGRQVFNNVPSGTYIAGVISILDNDMGNAVDIDFDVDPVTVN